MDPQLVPGTHDSIPYWYCDPAIENTTGLTDARASWNRQ
jgi:hypothetical protein